MGFFTLAAGGIGFILIGVSEALSSPPTKTPNQIQISPIISNPNRSPKSSSSSSSPSPSLVLASLFSSFAVLDSLFSFFDAISSGDRIGSALQLQTLAVASLFLLHSVPGILSRSSESSTIPLPSHLIDWIALFAFAEEFLLFYLQRKDTSGIENRYYDLILVPIGICVVSTAIGLNSPDSDFPRLGRSAGLVLQGTWLAQMAVSIHTGMVAHGCSVHSKSRGNYTVKCKGHGDYHRARAIATLQFNCHLALIVAVASVAYSVCSRKFAGDFSLAYRPIAAEMRTIESQAEQFTLDSDEEEEDGEIKAEQNSVEKIALNGHRVSHR